MDIASIEREALHLPRSDRARLAQNLLLSLETLNDAELNEAWLDEAQRRAHKIDQGETKLVSAEDVSIKAHALLK
jgi:putative addiction module component (TIGR02574 family)